MENQTGGKRLLWSGSAYKRGIFAFYGVIFGGIFFGILLVSILFLSMGYLPSLFFYILNGFTLLNLSLIYIIISAARAGQRYYYCVKAS